MQGNIHLFQSLKGLRFKLLMLCLGLFLFLFLFSVLGTSVKIQENMVQDLDQMPDMVKKMMGEGFAQSVIKYGIIMVGYIHPASIVLFLLFIFMAISQIISSEITTGTIGFTLSKPISRFRIFFNLWLVIHIGIALISLSAYASAFAGIKIFHQGRITPEPFLNISWNLFLLMIFVAGYIALIAVLSDTSKRMFTWGGILVFLMYLLSFAAPLWKPLEMIAPISPFTYYKPTAILMGDRINWQTSLGLILVSLLLFGIAAFLFKRRDISNG